MTSCICGGQRGYYDDPDEPREAYCTCAAAFRVRKRDEWQSVPERTVFVHPLTHFAIVKRHALGGHDPLIHVEERLPEGVTVKTGPCDDFWSIAADSDCPRDYAWPESAPPEVAAVVRQGIEDARKVKP